MSRNEHFRDADHLSLPVPADTPAGTAVLIGGTEGLKGFTQTPEGQGVGNDDGFATVWLKGSAVVPVTGAATVGAPVYIPPGGGALTMTATGNVKFGHALQAKGSGTAPIRVRVARA